MIQNIEAVIFDKDGTIADLHLYWGEIVRRRAAAVTAHYGLANGCYAEVCRAMGLALEEGRLLAEGPVGLTSREEVAQAVCSCLDRLCVKSSLETIAQLFAQVHEAFLPDIDRYLRAIPDTAEFCAALRRAGAKMAVVTSDSTVNTRHTLSRLGFESYFDVLVGRDTLPEPKISGAPARKALAALGVDSKRAICIGDAPMDCVMAKQSGCLAAVGVATGQTPASELAKHTPYVVLSMRELTGEIRA